MLSKLGVVAAAVSNVLDTDFCFRFSGFAVFFTVTNQGFELLSTYHLFSFDYSFTVKICLCVVLLGNMLD